MKVNAAPGILAGLMTAAALSQGETAAMLRVAPITVRMWLNGTNPTPLWAIELLEFKTAAPGWRDRLRA